MEVDDNELIHFGVKGMKWGVRKNYQAIRNQKLETLTVKTAKGTSVTLKERANGPIAASIGSVSKRFRRMLQESRAFSINVDGKTVGQTHFREKSKDELNFAWISINSKHRGKGYATSVFDAGVSYAKSKGYSKITLEVPGNAPDARHIYEKFGFEPTGVVLGHSGDIWGGLTVMAYDIPKTSSVRHSSEIDSAELELALEQTFNDPNADKYFWGGDAMHMDDPTSEFLEHFGVKGMKWGVRKASSGTASSGSLKPGMSEDARMAKQYKSMAKRGSTDALSTKELQALVTRMNLEQQYSRLKPPSKGSVAVKFVADVLLNAGKQQAAKFVNDQLTKQVEKMLTGK